MLSMTLAFTPAALAEDSSSSDADSPTAITQTDDSSSVVAQSDGSSSSAVQATEAPAPVAEQAPVTAQSTEDDGWHADASGTYYTRSDVRVVSDWIVTDVAPSGERVGWQRYWVGADGYLAKGRLVTDSESDRWAYAEANGTIARGRYTDPSTGDVYLADNDGRLESPGWHVTAAYDSSLQRYWVDATAHSCVPGYSADGWDHYTTSAGYVLRGTYTDPATGYLYLADNDGLLAGPGWVVGDYGDGLQRYWVDATAHACVPGYSADGWAHYTTSAGYVLRGTYTDHATGYLYLADNDGLLAGPGWVVGDYGDGLQRYWVDATAHACVPGYSTDGWAHYTTSAGYVLRGTSADPATGHVYLADNDGLLAGPGWVVGDYGYGLQRYWVDSATHACVPGYSKDGWAHWTTTSGYVLRGAQRYDDDGVLLADNEGKLAECYSSGGWLVTSAFTGSLERYRIDDCCGGILGAHVGSFSIDGNLYYGNPSTGYEYRNDYVSIGSTTYYADNDGVLTPAIQYHNVAWAGQPNNFFCGPTSGYMILRNVGAWTSARGDSLTIENVASYMDTRSYGYTSLQDRKFEQGMNDWLGDSIYTTIHTPSYAQVRSAVLSSYQTGYATAVDAMERRGGPHYNGHNNGTFAHIMVVDGYNSRTDAVYLVDPGAGVLWSSGSQHFWYPSLETFTETYLQTEYYNDGREHIGIYYAVK